MEEHDIISHVMREVDGIIDRQRTIRRVKDELENRRKNPHEEDFIYDEAFNGKRTTTEEIDGVTIEKTVIHRRGAHDTDIAGADLLFEIVDEKYILVQYKKVGGNGRVQNDRDQLEELIENCSNTCPPFRPSMIGTCGSWYCLIESNKLSYRPACIARSVFSNRNSCKASDFFDRSLDRGEFLSMFAKCFIGARVGTLPYTKPPSLRQLMLLAYSNNVPLVRVRQFGRL